MDSEDAEHLSDLLRHVGTVRDACQLLASRLIANGSETDEFIQSLVINSMTHDVSKFRGMEWKNLRRQFAGTEKFIEALL